METKRAGLNIFGPITPTDCGCRVDGVARSAPIHSQRTSMLRRSFAFTALLVAFSTIGAWPLLAQTRPGAEKNALDQELTARLQQLGFTGNIEATMEERLGSPVDPGRANLGRLLWFDPITGLNNDNSCAGCHSPTRGFGDTQSIAIGIDNNAIVGPHRAG